MTFNDEARHQTVTVTAVGEDIVRVDVVPDGWNGSRLPSLALDKSAKAEIKVEELEDMSVMRTGSGMKVVQFLILRLRVSSMSPFPITWRWVASAFARCSRSWPVRRWALTLKNLQKL